MAPNHCGHHGAHPNKIARRHGIPRITEPVDAAPFEHDQSVFPSRAFPPMLSAAPGLYTMVFTREIKWRLVGQQAL